MAFNKTDADPIVSTGFTGSRGLPANEAFGELFSGIATAANRGLQGYDASVQTKIELDATSSVDKIATENMPPDVQSILNQAQKEGTNLKTAKLQGVDTNLEFWTKYNEAVKRAKTQVPAGYASVVERAYSSAAGVSSANKEREARLSALNAQLSASDAAYKERLAFLRSDEAGMVASPHGRDLYYSAFKEQPDLNVSPLQNLLSVAAFMKADKAQADWEATLDAQSVSQARNMVANTVTRTINETLRDNNVAFSDFSKKLEELSKDGLTNEERVELLQQLAPMENTYKFKIRNKLTDRSNQAFLKLKPQEIEDAIANGASWFTGVRELLADPSAEATKFLADTLAADTTLMMNRTENDLMKIDSVRKGAALVKLGVMDAQTLMTFERETGDDGQPSIWTAKVKALKRYFKLGVIGGEVSIKEGLAAMQDVPPEQKAAALKDLLTKWATKTTPEQAAFMAKNIFKPDMVDFLTTQQADRISMFKLLANPEITQRLIASQDQQAFDLYTAWVDDQFAILAKKSAQDLADIRRYESGIGITFDGTHFTATTESTDVSSQAGLALTNRYIQEMNSYIDTAIPVWKQGGITKPEDIAARILFVTGDVSRIPKEQTFLRKLWGSVSDFLATESKTTTTGPTGVKSSPSTREPLPKPSSDAGNVIMQNQSAGRRRPITGTLEEKLSRAVSTVFGEGYEARVFSGGQLPAEEAKKKKEKHIGSIRHDHGKAADVYIYGPDGKKVTDKDTLDKLKAYWLENDMGSVGTYMHGAGLHLDEWTKEELIGKMASSWSY